MKALRAVLADRRRSQRGSVLSGVLIIVMFLSILAGALMTELSSNFLLSHALVVRATNQATVNSSIELALDSLQTAAMTSACPGLTPVSLNGQMASPTYLRCALVVSTGSLPAVKRIHSSSGPVDVDGAFISLPGLLPGSGDEYLLADSAGTLFAYPFGQSTARWSYLLGATPTAPPLAINGGSGEISDLVPVLYGSPTSFAVALLEEDNPGQRPSFNCYMHANAQVTAAPAAGRNARRSVYFGDASGTVFAYDATAGGNCPLKDTLVLPGNLPVVAGPVVFPGSNSHTDELYVVGSDGSSSEIFHLRYNANNRNVSLVASLPLPSGRVVGMVVNDAGSVPASLAIALTGELSLVQIDSGYGVTVLAATSVPGGGVTNAPGWCQPCRGGLGVIGVGGTNGLHLFDSALNPYGNFPGPQIHSTPVADAGGDWFVTGDDGVLYELQRPANQQAMTLAKTFTGGTSPISSSPVMHQCPAGLCIYFAADSKTYLVPLDAHEAVMTACITSPVTPTTCTPDNPRAWVSVEVDSTNAPQAVHILGWSYYSP